MGRHCDAPDCEGSSRSDVWAGEGLELALNPHRRDEPYPAELDACLSRGGAEEARAVLRAWPGHVPTPLCALPGLARALGVDSVHCKDEGPRFGLGSFKALGGAYAVYRIVAAAVAAAADAGGLDVTPYGLPSPAALAAARPAAASRLTFACATAGNHGRSVAWGARLFGAQAVIYMHGGVPAAAEAAAVALGARVVRVPGSYDDSVRDLAADAARHGWTVVADTAWPRYESVPRDIKLGYTLAPQEAAEQLALEGQPPPTHVFVQAGVGGLAAAVAATLWQASGDQPWPHLVVVEPATAACLLASCKAGRAKALCGDVSSAMTGLACGVPSPIAWPVLDAAAAAFATVTDAAALEAQRILASGELGARISAGPSGAAGVACLLALARSTEARHLLQLGPESRVLLFVTEVGAPLQ